jgi:hypothetical protein
MIMYGSKAKVHLHVEYEVLCQIRHLSRVHNVYQISTDNQNGHQKIYLLHTQNPHSRDI